MIDRSTDAMARRREALPTVDLTLRSTRAFALWSAGRLSDDVEYAEREWKAAINAGELEPAAMFAFCRAGALTDMGRIDEAIASLRDTAGSFKELGIPIYQSWSFAFLARALALTGDVSAAGAALERAERTRPPQVVLGDPELRAARVWIAVAEGDTAGARAAALEDAATHLQSGRLIAASRSLHDVARLGGARAGRTPPGGFEHGDGRRRRSGVRGARARTCSIRRTRSHVGRQAFRGARLHVVGQRRRTRAPRRRSSPRGDPRAAGAQAPALAHSSPGAEGPGRPRSAGLSVGVSLTRRELDVALLAARGLANREIADAPGAVGSYGRVTPGADLSQARRQRPQGARGDTRPLRLSAPACQRVAPPP